MVITILAHIDDSNLHANLRITLAELGPHGDVPDRAWRAADELITTALALGGTITGEHGIGLLKSHWLRADLGDAQYRVHQAIKAALAPQGILNSGKVFAVEPPID